MNRPSAVKPEAGPVPKARHPRGLYTLFFTEMWERFSYYGMRALLVLFMADAVRHGGLGFTDKKAAAIYGLYTAGVYLATLPGGWIADRLLGAQRAVFLGGCVIAAGHFSLAIPRLPAFYLGLVLLVFGTGLLKPNVSAMVGQLYPGGGAGRDAGFTIFYMGINLGAAIGPLICSTLGEKVNWHYGFAAAGVGMVLGLVQYRLTRRHLGDAGRFPGAGGRTRRRDVGLVLGALAVIVFVLALAFGGVLPIHPVTLAQNATVTIVSLAALYFISVFAFGGLDRTEKKRVVVIIVLFISASMFWSGFEQAGSSLNLFAQNFTLRTFGGFQVPAGWLQTLNPIFIIVLAPVIASTWVALAQRRVNPSLPVKFAMGLILLGAGFFVMSQASRVAETAGKVWPTWLITTYLLHTVGELCLSPVGLSAVTKLSPPRLVGQMMGVWFLADSLGSLIAGLIAGQVTGRQIHQMPGRFLQIVATTCGTAVLLLLFSKPIKKLMSGID